MYSIYFLFGIVAYVCSNAGIEAADDDFFERVETDTCVIAADTVISERVETATCVIAADTVISERVDTATCVTNSGRIILECTLPKSSVKYTYVIHT